MSEQETHAGDRAQVKKREKQGEREQQRIENDLRAVLAMPEGRRVLASLIFEKCHLNQTSYHPSGQQFACNEGRRSVGVELQADIMAADFDLWLKLLAEHHVKPDV